MMEKRLNLETAYVRILIGLNMLDCVFPCRIDGHSFNIRIEEVKYLETKFQLHHSWESDPDSYSSSPAAWDFDDHDSIVACLGEQPIPEAGVERSLRVESIASVLSTHVGSVKDLKRQRVIIMQARNRYP